VSARSLAVAIVLAALPLVVGCSADAEDDGSVSSELGGGHGHGGGHGPRGHGPHGHAWHGGHHGHQVIASPQGAYVADINATGSGCQDGTWDASISEDGQTFTLRFSAYEVNLEAGAQQAQSDCQVAIGLKSPDGLSYAVGQVFYSGYVFLEQPGMTAMHTTRYSFDGVPGSERRADRDVIRDVIDSEYTFDSPIPAPHQVWSPCGGDRTLLVNTGLMVRNNRQRTGTGYMNSSAIDGSLDPGGTDVPTMTWNLNWRRCQP
jgi:hypothetical protein